MELNMVPIFLFSLYSSLLDSAWCKQAWEVNEDLANGAVYGDMILTPLQGQRYEGVGDKLNVRGVSLKESTVNRWENNLVPYALSPMYSETQKQTLRNSLQRFEQISCFKFRERTSEVDYLFIVPLDGCYSYVGKIGGRQKMSLAADCIADYIIWHEMMHALGFEHEHQRPDRDSFIRVEYQNVQQGQLMNFNKLMPYDVDYPDNYDYDSIMHYDSFAFGKVDTGRQIRLATMTPIKTGVRLDDNSKFSATDIAKLNRLGKCAGSGPILPPSAIFESKAKVSGGCRDLARNCGTMRQKGMCTMPFFRASMLKSCAATCQLCPKLADDPSSQDGNTSECRDTATVDCSKFVEVCGNKVYELLMAAHCPATCGLCSQRQGDARQACQDLNEKCATYVANGFCTNEFYASIRATTCPKSCQLC